MNDQEKFQCDVTCGIKKLPYIRQEQRARFLIKRNNITKRSIDNRILGQVDTLSLVYCLIHSGFARHGFQRIRLRGLSSKAIGNFLRSGVMPVNALRKSGARMSLQEAQDRVGKLERLSHSSNRHEAALAAMRLKSFDVETARAPRVESVVDETSIRGDNLNADKHIEILEELPDIPYETMEEIDVQQSADKSKVNWDELHFELIKKAQIMGADALLHIQLKGTPDQKVLGATALKYLTPMEIQEIEQSQAMEKDQKAHEESRKERRDESTAPEL